MNVSLWPVDLGMDQVKVYEFDHETGKIKLHDILRCELESGPKHMIFTSDGRYAYLTHENKCCVTKYAYDAETALYKCFRQFLHCLRSMITTTVPTLNCTPDDRYLFVTNSGNNSVATMRLMKKSDDEDIMYSSGQW